MLRSIYLKGLRDQRRSLLLWALGIAAFAAVEFAVYPAVRKSAGVLDQYVKNLPKAFKDAFLGSNLDFGSPAGFLNAEMFSFMSPVIFLVFAIGAGARAVAGEEEAGTLDLLVSCPVSRRDIVLQKFGVVATGVAALTLTLFASLAIGAAVANMRVATSMLLQASMLVGLLALTFGAVAFAAAGYSGRRATGIAVASGLAVALYLLNALGQLVDAIDPFRKFSFFYYYRGGDTLSRGLDAANGAVFLVATVMLLAAALVGFERRDLRS